MKVWKKFSSLFYILVPIDAESLGIYSEENSEVKYSLILRSSICQFLLNEKVMPVMVSDYCRMKIIAPFLRKMLHKQGSRTEEMKI